MQFLIPVEVQLCPPSPFLDLWDAVDRLRDYGWREVALDSGPSGKLSACETRTIRYTLQGKPGASRNTALRDVQDAMAGLGSTVKWLRNLDDKVKEGLVSTASAGGEALGGGVSGFGHSVGLGGGVGALLAGGAFTILLVAVGIVVLVVAVRRT